MSKQFVGFPDGLDDIDDLELDARVPRHTLVKSCVCKVHTEEVSDCMRGDRDQSSALQIYW